MPVWISKLMIFGGEFVAATDARPPIAASESPLSIRRPLDAEDVQANDRALQSGGGLFSSYRSSRNVKFWIITECDRSVTTVLLPEDY